MAKNQRPMLQAPVLSGIPGRLASEPIPATDPRYAAAEALESSDIVHRRVQEGSVRVLNTDTAPRNEAPPNPVPAARRRSPELSLSTKVPEYVMQQLRMRSAERGVTIRNLLLLALRREGLEIDEDDMQDERKRR